MHVPGEPTIQRGRILLQPHDSPARREGGAVAGGMPGRSGSQIALFQQDGVGPSQTGEMVQTATADRAAADDQDTYVLDHGRSASASKDRALGAADLA